MVFEVVIIGGGFSGLCLAHQLTRKGILDFVILEKANEVGGTWRDNTYPGCACDVQSHLYSYSFAGNPDWTKTYAGWREIQDYILSFTEKEGLRNNIRFNQEVVSADFDESRGKWVIVSQTGERYESRFLVNGIGLLHQPALPAIPGLDTFQGPVFHSARWRHDIDLTDKSVVSIGTGGSAIQYIPEVAEQAGKLSVFQRTPAWVIPRRERKYGRFERRLYRAFPLLRKLHRLRFYLTNEFRILAVWNPWIAGLVAMVARSHIRRSVADPEIAEKLTPNYTVGCKRVLVSNKFYPAFNQPHVHLVTKKIDKIVPEGVLTEDGEIHDADVIVLGTGFLADPREYMQGLTIKGLGGRELLNEWKNGPESYYGMTTHGFPNMFQMTGPNTALGHSSVIYMIESQVNYIVDGITRLRQTGADYLDVKADVLKAFNQKLQDKLAGTVWTTGCTSWYQQKEGKNIAIWPGTTFSYRSQTRTFNLADYDIVSRSRAEKESGFTVTEPVS